MPVTENTKRQNKELQSVLLSFATPKTQVSTNDTLDVKRNFFLSLLGNPQTRSKLYDDNVCLHLGLVILIKIANDLN